jgi:trans-aconitate methyltransferase
MKWNADLYDRSHDFVSRYGAGLLSYLQPMPGEIILDLGCGTGELTNEISLSGAKAIGIDSSANMVQVAAAKFPETTFFQMDARDMQFDILFDAVFSNAALHWIPEKEKVIERMYSLLKPGGRIVLEFGGKGNNQHLIQALRNTFIERKFYENAEIDFWYFPSVGQYATELEKQNFRVIHAEHFDRTTPLKGAAGVKDWFTMFGEYFFAGISETEKDEILDEVEHKLAPTHYIDGTWYADYKRIRIIAVKQ